jgi:hypothetical protein
MLVPDVNLLLHAYNSESAYHSVARHWWEETLGLERPVGLAWVAVLGFMRLMTGRHLRKEPVPLGAVIACVREWLERPHVRILTPGERHAEILLRLLEHVGVGGDLTTDAHLAALAIEYQAELVSTDVDFARFPGLRWFNPLRLR